MHPFGIIAIAAGLVGWLSVMISMQHDKNYIAPIRSRTLPLTRPLTTENYLLRDPSATHKVIAVELETLHFDAPVSGESLPAPSPVTTPSFLPSETTNQLFVSQVEQAARKGAYDGAIQAELEKELSHMLDGSE